jgi:hypothetical protein
VETIHQTEDRFKTQQFHNGEFEEVTLVRFWGVGEEKSDRLESGGFYGQITAKLHMRIQQQAVQLFETSGKAKT